MIRGMFMSIVCLGAWTAGALGQECKTKFAVAYTDGKTLQVGLTQEQKKFWDHDGAKKFKRMCLDQLKPDYLILWTYGLSGAELNQVGVDSYNRARETGQATSGPNSTSNEKTSTTDTRWMDSNVFIRPSAVVRAKADYWVLDTSKQPYPVIRKGQGYRDLPDGMDVVNRPGEKSSVSDSASTIADPAVALENALKWLKKDKKL